MKVGKSIYRKLSIFSSERRKRSSDSQTRSFTIGTQGDCGGVAPGTYCNGQLKPGTSYKYLRLLHSGHKSSRGYWLLFRFFHMV